MFFLGKNGWKRKQYIAVKDNLFFSQLKLLQLIVQRFLIARFCKVFIMFSIYYLCYSMLVKIKVASQHKGCYYDTTDNKQQPVLE